MDYPSFERLEENKKSSIINAGIQEFSAYTYDEASTDRITKNCNISKGLLFHYFGTKKNYYIYCVNYAFSLLTQYDIPEIKGDFYNILFSEMEQKMLLCEKHPAEILFVNHVAKETASAVSKEKNILLAQYAKQTQIRSKEILVAAVKTIQLKVTQEAAIDCLQIYTGAVMSKYMAQFQNNPADFFVQKKKIKAEIKKYLDKMLYGISEVEK